jgi:PAS domain S-box-containing protein
VQVPPPELAALGEVDALLVDEQDHLWIAASQRGLQRYDGERVEPVAVAELGGRRVTTLASSARGGLWILGPELGALRWSEGRVVESLSVEVLGGEPQVLREAPDGTLWVGTTGGVARVRAGETRLFTTAEGLAPGTIRDVMLHSDGIVWVGSYGGGLAALRPDGQIVRVTRDHGLCDNVASRLIDDGVGTVWINGNRGVYRVRYKDLEAVAEGRSVSLQCGLLASGEGNGNGGFRANDDRLWFPTISGVVVIDRRDVGEPVAPIGHIASMSLAGVPVDEGQELPPMVGDLVVEMTALSFGDPRGLYFRYRLNGYDAATVDAGTTRVVRYTRLPPGRYRFEFEARSVDGVSSALVGRSFELQPHFYQRWRFILLLLVALGLLVWGVFRLRTRAMARHNRALEREIAERAKITEALRLQELHYRTLFEGTSDGIFVHEPSGRLVELNPAGSRLLQRTRAELLGSEPLSHVEPEGRQAYRSLLERALAGQTVAPVELRLVAAGGAAVDVRLGAVRIDQKSRPHVLISAVDLTAERRAERERQALELQLRQSQKLEALGQLAGGIAHDFNNLLTAIGVQASLLQGADQDEIEAIEGISVAVKRAAALTKKLLVFGRQDLHSPVVLTVAAQLDELMTVLRRTVPADVRLVLENQAPGVRVRVDPVRLEQMIINLVVNARDAIRGVGTIRIVTACLVMGESEALQRGCRPGEYVTITVSDDGCGIEPTVIERIFEPFFTTKDVGKGWGLGLSIVHGAIREAGGFVTVDSALGRGSTFVLHLPLVDDVVAEPAGAVVATLSGEGLTVLLCDDELIVRKASAKALRSVGYRVLEAEGPDDAIDLARQHVRELRVLVTDVVMPVMSGPELARRVRAVAGELPVLFISGHTRDVVIDRGVGGEAEFLAKPFTVDVLVGRVGALIARATPAHGVEVVRREDLN